MLAQGKVQTSPSITSINTVKIFQQVAERGINTDTHYDTKKLVINCNLARVILL